MTIPQQFSLLEDCENFVCQQKLPMSSMKTQFHLTERIDGKNLQDSCLRLSFYFQYAINVGLMIELFAAHLTLSKTSPLELAFGT